MRLRNGGDVDMVGEHLDEGGLRRQELSRHFLQSLIELSPNPAAKSGLAAGEPERSYPANGAKRTDLQPVLPSMGNQSDEVKQWPNEKKQPGLAPSLPANTGAW